MHFYLGPITRNLARQVLKGFVHEAKRHFHDIAHEVNLPFFFDVIQNSEYVDVRKVPYGANEYKAGYVNNREYKDHHMLFMDSSSLSNSLFSKKKILILIR